MRKRRHPDWLKVPLAGGSTTRSVQKLLRSSHLHTICEEAKCPNRGECFGRGTATFLILGPVCTRNCRYCHVAHGSPLPVDSKEPTNIADSVHHLGLNYVVLTSVTRDDLPDYGASQFRSTIEEIRKKNPYCKIEILIPDFQGSSSSLDTVLSAQPNVLNHNIEVVESLFPLMRPDGNYHRSLSVLSLSKKCYPSIPTKSGFMIGLGESWDEILVVMDDLIKANVDFLTIGQYLQPTVDHAHIKKYYTPDEFKLLEHYAKEIGFSFVASGPLVRSSYKAEQALSRT